MNAATLSELGDCPQCGATLTPDDLRENGRRVDCPNCGKTLRSPPDPKRVSWAVWSGNAVVSILVLACTVVLAAAMIALILGAFQGAITALAVFAGAAVVTTFVGLFVRAVEVLEDIRDELRNR